MKKFIKRVAIIGAVLFVGSAVVAGISDGVQGKPEAKQETKQETTTTHTEKAKPKKEAPKVDQAKVDFKKQANDYALAIKKIQNIDLNVVSDDEYTQVKTDTQHLSDQQNALLNTTFAKTDEGNAICSDLSKALQHTQLFVFNYQIDDAKTLKHDAELGIGYLDLAQASIDKL